jgi:hypothetical protein
MPHSRHGTGAPLRLGLPVLLLSLVAPTPLRSTGGHDAVALDVDSVAAANSASLAGSGFDASPSPRFTVLDPELLPLRRGRGPALESDSGSAAAAPIALYVGGERVALRVAALPVLPGEKLRLAGPEGATLVHQAGEVESSGRHGWEWRAPREPGAYALRVEHAGAAVDLTALVMHSADRVEAGRLGGYAIGRYMETPLRGDPAYLPPTGFVEVGGGDADLLVSPRLTLGQFLCKQPGDPRFVAVSPALLVKLEAILDRVEFEGWDPAALVVMSGFRTPAYNRAIGNTTVYSRHLWGDAADIYLDADGDGVMDDLDGDGRRDSGDAAVLAAWVEEVVAHHDHIVPGGLATYRANAAHGPFVHVDARGHRARW